jgi:hypothetical protein
MATDEDAAPGWDALEAAFARLYPGQEPHHWASLMPTRVVFGGPEVIDGFSAYAATDPKPHWHWLTYGLTELYAKDGDDPEWSGWGYELTMRVLRAGEGMPAMWPLQALQTVANWAHRSERVLEAGDFWDTGKPLAGDEPCDLTGMAFAADAELPPLATPHGRVELLQLVCLHPVEAELCARDGVDALLHGRFAGDFNVLSRGSLI